MDDFRYGNVGGYHGKRYSLFFLGSFFSLVLGEFLSPESIYWIAGHRGQKLHNEQKEQNIDIADNNFPIFRTGQDLPVVQDAFIRDVVHPSLIKYISPGQVYVIEIFNFFNAVVLLPTAEIFQWVGIWDLLNNWINWNNPPGKESVYLVVGFLLILIAYKYLGWEVGWIDVEDSWKEGLSKRFGWRRKLKNFGRSTFSFVGFLFVWVGASLLWDYEVESALMYGMYVLCSSIALLVFAELFSVDSLFYIDTKLTMMWRKMRGTTEDDDMIYVELV